jgi:hypothetical protein
VTCEVSRCRAELDVVFYGHEVCEKHWEAHCAGKLDLKKKLAVRTDGQLTLR